MASQLPLTELEAVNLMIMSVGEQPISSILTDSGNSYVAIAVSLLNNTSRNLQSSGHSFNNETNYPLAIDTSGFINVPTNVLRVKPMDRSKKVVQRGSRLYDKLNHTYVFTETLLVDITFFFEFEEIPQAARGLIYVMASRDFQKKVLGSDTITSITKEDELMAWVNFREEESDVDNNNIFDSYDTARPIMRHTNPIAVGR